MKGDWFKSAVGYQIYPKSFKDTNDDGIGDIGGIIEKLPYLKELGIDFLWLNPIYQSPQIDGGYDISNFYEIDESFGTIDDLKVLLKEAHELDIKVIMDLVVNHTSDQHPWFLESKKSLDNPYRNYYHWEDASESEPPNNWISFFGGSTWTYDESTKQSYFHVFAKEQPDLNWKNPNMRHEIYSMIRWWLELGIDGFRIDAISHIQKEKWDFKIVSFDGDDPWQPFMNVPGIEDYMFELKDIFDEYDALTVGEASGVESIEANKWTGQDGYLDMIFELGHAVKKEEIPDTEVKNKVDVKKYKKEIIKWQEDLLENGWNGTYLENHDNPRSIDIYGDGTIKSAKPFAVQYMLMRGTPFIYQGQELGMTNYPFDNIDQIDVPDSHHAYNKLIDEGYSKEDAIQKVGITSRDNSRTPMQWDNSYNAGFTQGKPWLVINPNYNHVNAKDAMKMESSLFKLYQRLIKLRHDRKTISIGTIEFINKEDDNVFVYRRVVEGSEILVITNLSNDTYKINLEIDDVKSYEEVELDQESPHKLHKEMNLDPWEYRIYEK